MLERQEKCFLPMVFLALAAAYSIRFLQLPAGWDTLALLVRSGIFLILFFIWGILVRQRMVQPQMRRLFTAIAAMMTFWMMVRTIKFLFQPGGLARYCWYLYYVPMLFIPLLTTLTAVQLGKGESSRLPKWTPWLFAAAAGIVLLVLSNDFHQLVFVFPAGQPFSDARYSYGPGMLAAALWQYGGLLATLGLVVIRCRLPQRGRRMLAPVIPALLLVLYHLCYWLEFDWLRFFFGDLTVTECFLVVCILECCLQTGLIPSNSGYTQLFASADLTAVITDEDYHVQYVSRNASVFPVELMRQACQDLLMVDKGSQLQSMALSKGHLLWTTDVSDLLALQESLELTREELADRNEALRHFYEQEQEHRRIQEQNRLYDLLQRKAQSQMDQIRRLADEYACAPTAEKKREILCQIIFLASYVKRRKDFVLSMDAEPVLPESRLEQALAESYRALSLLGVQGTYHVKTGQEQLDAHQLVAAYDFFEDVAEGMLDRLECINVIVCSVEGRLRISILADCPDAVPWLQQNYPQAILEADEDGVLAVLFLERGSGR